MPDLTFNRLSAANEERAIEWQNGKSTTEEFLEFATIELAGEAGEAADAVKKYLRWKMGMVGGVNREQSLVAIGEELGDVVISAERVARTLGLNLGEITAAKFNKTSDEKGLSVKL